MSIRSRKDLDGLRTIGRVVRLTLDTVKAAVRPGVTTAALDEIAGRVLAENGAQSAPPMVYGFPGQLCISVNDEAIHGIPGRRRLRAGDLVKLDLVAEKDGYFADAAVTVEVGEARGEGRGLRECAEAAFEQGLRAARAGNRAYDIGREVERETKRRGFEVMKALRGHGVGRTIHEPPSIPNHMDPSARARLTEGMVITIEPIVTTGCGEAELQEDRWTIKTADRGWAAHFEHTVLITGGEPVLLTA